MKVADPCSISSPYCYRGPCFMSGDGNYLSFHVSLLCHTPLYYASKQLLLLILCAFLSHALLLHARYDSYYLSFYVPYHRCGCVLGSRLSDILQFPRPLLGGCIAHFRSFGSFPAHFFCQRFSNMFSVSVFSTRFQFRQFSRLFFQHMYFLGLPNHLGRTSMQLL